MHQSVVMLQWLDPPLEPAQSGVLASESHLHKFSNPPCAPLEQRVAGNVSGHVPALDLIRDNILEGRKTLSFARGGLVLVVEEEPIPESR